MAFLLSIGANGGGVMRVRRYRGRHLRLRPRKRGRAVVGTAAAVWFSGSSAQAAEHVVAPGETLSDIAARYGTSVSALASANRLVNPNFIVAGQRLRVPSSVAVSSVHVVRRGENLSSIASRYGTSIASLARANKIRDPNFVVAGTKLRIPGGGSAVATTAVATSSAPVTDVGAEIHEQAVAHGVDPSLAKAVAWQESGWQQAAVSSVGAVGVMQVMPDTADYVNSSLGGHGLSLRSAEGNIHLGVMYLRHMLDTMPSERKALAAYYSGPGAMGRSLNSGQRAYASNVQALKERFR